MFFTCDKCGTFLIPVSYYTSYGVYYCPRCKEQERYPKISNTVYVGNTKTIQQGDKNDNIR